MDNLIISRGVLTGVSNRDITEAVIPNSVTSIGLNAFNGCSGLTSITIPDSVTSIRWGAFAHCSGLTSITIPNSVTSIDGHAFEDCTGLTSITIPNTVTSIGDKAFYDSRDNCNAIIETATNTLILGCRNTVIPSSVTSIGGDAFYGCSGLTNITIPDNVTTIKRGAFLGCTGLTNITIPDGVTSIDQFTFQECTGLTSITIPNSVTSIGLHAFNGCSGLTNFTIPNSVTSIGNGAFAHCSGLTSIKIPDSVTRIDDDAFSGCSGLTSITIPNSVTSIDGHAFENCTGLTSITIPDSVTSIRWGAFAHCSGLTSITIPNSVTSIDGYAFEGCTGLTSITIPNSVTSIGDSAFYGCSGLTNITIPNSVTRIDGHAFEGCTGLTSIKIPNSVTSIGVDVFAKNDYLEKEFTDTEGMFVIDGVLLQYKGGKKEVTISKNVTRISQYAFSKCKELTSVIIPESITSIGNRAFARCSGLTSITIPDSVTSIGDSAFDGCIGLTSITIPDSVTSIGDSAFAHCSGLKSITFQNSVTSIGWKAFEKCEKLKKVITPNPENIAKRIGLRASVKIITPEEDNKPRGRKTASKAVKAVDENKVKLFLISDDDAEHTLALFGEKKYATFFQKNHGTGNEIIVKAFECDKKSENDIYYFVVNEYEYALEKKCFASKQDAIEFVKKNHLYDHFEIHGHKLNSIEPADGDAIDENNNLVNVEPDEESFSKVYNLMRENNIPCTAFNTEYIMELPVCELREKYYGKKRIAIVVNGPDMIDDMKAGKGKDGLFHVCRGNLKFEDIVPLPNQDDEKNIEPDYYFDSIEEAEKFECPIYVVTRRNVYYDSPKAIKVFKSNYGSRFKTFGEIYNYATSLNEDGLDFSANVVVNPRVETF